MIIDWNLTLSLLLALFMFDLLRGGARELVWKVENIFDNLRPITKARKAGETAFQAGIGIGACPFKQNDDLELCASWREGWKCGKAEDY